MGRITFIWHECMYPELTGEFGKHIIQVIIS